MPSARCARWSRTCRRRSTATISSRCASRSAASCPPRSASCAVLERDPDQVDARLDLARALRRKGDLAEAIVHTRSAFDRTGQALDVAEELFYLLCEADDLAGATDLLTLLDDDRSDVDALALVARLDRGLGRLDAARAVTARLAAQDADAGAVAEAELDIAAGDPPPAPRARSPSPTTSPHFAQARRVAGEALLAAGDPTHALGALAPARAQRAADLELALVAAYAGGPTLGRARRSRAARSRRSLPARATELAIARTRRRSRRRSRGRARDPRAAARREPRSRRGARTSPATCSPMRTSGSPTPSATCSRARDLQPGDPAVLDSWGWLQLTPRPRARRRARASAGHAALRRASRRSCCTSPRRGPPTARRAQRAAWPCSTPPTRAIRRRRCNSGSRRCARRLAAVLR